MPTLECSIDSRVVIALINSVQGAGVVSWDIIDSGLGCKIKLARLFAKMLVN